MPCLLPGGDVAGMDGELTSRGREDERARRRATRDLTGAYHEEQLRESRLGVVPARHRAAGV